MKIRNVKANDINVFVRLYYKAYRGLEKYAYTKERDIKRYFKWLLSRDPNGFFIAELEEPVGFVACDTNWFSPFERSRVGEIHELFVHPNFRGKGVGRMLVKKAIEYAKSRKRKKAGLWVGVENYSAKQF
ncbi:N-acetyltransferase, partial [Candidatus Bathyarchaeota archaeon]